MAAPKTREEREGEAAATLRTAFAPRAAGAAPDPVGEVVTAQLSKLIARIDDLEARVAELEAGR